MKAHDLEPDRNFPRRNPYDLPACLTIFDPVDNTYTRTPDT